MRRSWAACTLVGRRRGAWGYSWLRDPPARSFVRVGVRASVQGLILCVCVQARAPEFLRDGEGSVTCNSGAFPAILHLFTPTNGLALREKRLSSFSTFESREVLSSATTREVGDRLGLLVWRGRVPHRFRDVGKRGKEGERRGAIGSAALLESNRS